MTLETVPAHAPLELEHFLPYRLSILSNTVSQSIASEYQDRFELSMTEWRVMTILARFPEISAREVVDRSAMDKVAVSRAVARLLERGFIQRETHGDDRRRSVLHLSAAGVEVYQVVAPMVLECERRLLAPFSEEEQRLLNRLIDRLAAEGLPSMTGK
ncbi:MarR family transcriptional regulator [Xanthomonas hyacinthi DSM 19077]|nr:MarR family transcriptional regulator [Xanthomonas hyacinthi DSM 19077]